MMDREELIKQIVTMVQENTIIMNQEVIKTDEEGIRNDLKQLLSTAFPNNCQLCNYPFKDESNYDMLDDIKVCEYCFTQAKQKST